MCGIFGVFNNGSVDIDAARRALHLLSHRGPDQWSDYHNENVYIGHRRLSIRDLSERGRQPFVDPETGVVVAVNGEVWNDKALREKLGEARFRGDSDCEVFLHGYLSWGVDRLLEVVDGFYAAVIYDPRTERLFLIKDRWGKKPLYYAETSRGLIFASEAKSLLEYDDSLRVFDYEGIKHWMAYRGSHFKRTIFYGVNKVIQGRYLEVDARLGVSERTHFDLVRHAASLDPITRRSPDVIDEDVSGLLSSAIHKRMASDVPVGLQLSGGIDSSLLAAKLREETDSEFHSYSVVFKQDMDQAYSEERYSDQVAQQYGLSHHKLAIDKEMIGGELGHLIYLFDGMLDIPNAIPIYLMCRYAKENVTVFLAGEGADELFGGYGKYQKAAAYRRRSGSARHLPEWFFDLDFRVNRIKHRYIHKLYLMKHYGGQERLLLDHLNSFVSPLTVQRYFGPLETTLVDTLETNELQRFSFIKQLMLVDHMTYLNFLLERQDKASMGAGVEARLPFLDFDLVSYVLRLSDTELLDESMAKKPLKRLAERYFGREFVHRPKVGFPLPIAEWLEDDEAFGPGLRKIYSKNFLLMQHAEREGLMDYLASGAFDLRQLSYGDSEKVWLKWQLMVLAEAQDIFRITDIR